MKTITNKYFLISLISLIIASSQAFGQHNHNNGSSNKNKMGHCKTQSGITEERASANNKITEISQLQIIDENKDGQIFYCIMYDGEFSDKSGKCPLCGMEMKEISIIDAESMLSNTAEGMMDNCKGKHSNMDHSGMMNSQVENTGEDIAAISESSIVRQGEIDLKTIDKNKDGKVFQDQMDWNVISDEPGECPLCGMNLQEISIKNAKENLISHNFKVTD